MATNRANRTSIERTEDGKAWIAHFYRTHKHMGDMRSTDTAWTAPKDANTTTEREDFRAWAQDHAEDIGLDWKPQLQTQSWDRHYWKYETDEQVEEDALELMAWTIKGLCEKAKLTVSIDDISLDSIVPMESPLTYVEKGRYAKNGNWAVAQVNIEVTATIDDTEVELVYPIEMRSGQLTKIKLTVDEIKGMVSDSKTA